MASIITKFRSTPAERKDIENAIAKPSLQTLRPSRTTTS